MQMLISFAVSYKWRAGKWSNSRLNDRQIRQHCFHLTTNATHPSTRTDNSLFVHEKSNPNPLLIGYKVRNVYCTSTSISKAQQHVGGKSQDSGDGGDIDKTFYISREDKGEQEIRNTVSSKFGTQQQVQQHNMSDPFLTSSSFTTSN